MIVGGDRKGNPFSLPPSQTPRNPCEARIPSAIARVFNNGTTGGFLKGSGGCRSTSGLRARRVSEQCVPAMPYLTPPHTILCSINLSVFLFALAEMKARRMERRENWENFAAPCALCCLGCVADRHLPFLLLLLSTRAREHTHTPIEWIEIEWERIQPGAACRFQYTNACAHASNFECATPRQPPACVAMCCATLARSGRKPYRAGSSTWRTWDLVGPVGNESLTFGTT